MFAVKLSGECTVYVNISHHNNKLSHKYSNTLSFLSLNPLIHQLS